MKNKFRFCSFLAILFTNSYASNFNDFDQVTCRKIFNESQNYNIGSVNKNSIFYIDKYMSDQKNANKCPESYQVCHDSFNSYVPKDNIIITGKNYNNFTCVYDINKKSTGWINSDNIVINAENCLYLSKDFIGNWIDEDNVSKIKFIENGEQIKVIGNSKWNSGFSEHIGDFESSIPKNLIFNNSFNILTEFGCSVKFKMINKNILIIQDNVECGGMNVNFNGVYSKEK